MIKRLTSAKQQRRREHDDDGRRVCQRVREGGHSVPEAKVSLRYARCHQLFPRVIETSDEAIVYDASTLPATLVFERVDGILGGCDLTPWAKAHLLEPLRERNEDRERAEAECAASGVSLSLPDEGSGAYVGLARGCFRHYILQSWTGDDSSECWIRHDQALLERGRPKRLAVGREFSLKYQSGWAV